MVVLEGKTKRIEPIGKGLGRFHSKDDLTAGDGKRHDVVAGKAKLANSTTCHVFDYLQIMGVPLAYVDRDDDTFIAQIITMIPVEIVVRNEAAGSYCKRHASIPSGTKFSEPVVEFFYKTTDRNFKGVTLDYDDPLMVFSSDGTELALYPPCQRADSAHPVFIVTGDLISRAERIRLHQQLAVCAGLALEVNRLLKAAWEQQHGHLIDFKIECGVTDDGEIVVGDVIDCDSWRVIWQGRQLSKQPYRDGDDPASVLETYQIADALVERFCVPPELHS